MTWLTHSLWDLMGSKKLIAHFISPYQDNIRDTVSSTNYLGMTNLQSTNTLRVPAHIHCRQTIIIWLALSHVIMDQVLLVHPFAAARIDTGNAI